MVVLLTGASCVWQDIIAVSSDAKSLPNEAGEGRKADCLVTHGVVYIFKTILFRPKCDMQLGR